MLDPKKLHFRFHKSIAKEVSIVVGQGCYQLLDKLATPLAADRFFVICDTVILPLHGHKIRNVLQNVSPSHLLIHAPDEKSKTLKTVEKLINEFFDLGGSARSCLCALGGGVTGNMTGLIASILFRGIRFFHVPTTLLAQLDSAPDVKQSVNAPTMKNAIGAYKAPEFVVVDPSFLETLGDREIRSGLAEAVKHAFAQDLDFLDFIVSSASRNELRNLDVLEQIIVKAISLKIRHWETTPTMWSDGKRVERLTHLGHTVGKALEMVKLDHLTHGEAISHGMVIEFYISSQMGYLDPASVDYAERILSRLGLLFPLDESFTTERILSKLYASGFEEHQPLFALLKDLGNPNTISTVVPSELVSRAVGWYLESPDG